MRSPVELLGEPVALTEYPFFLLESAINSVSFCVFYIEAGVFIEILD